MCENKSVDSSHSQQSEIPKSSHHSDSKAKSINYTSNPTKRPMSASRRTL